MRAALTVAAALIAGLPAASAQAHRIDEYLQATLVTIRADRIEASLRLVPGALIAASVMSDIDTNADGVFSDTEQQVYAERVLRDQSITLDGQAVQPTLSSWRFPSPAQVRDGLGEIHIKYRIEATRSEVSGDAALRKLVLTNRHQNGGSVYLANTLVPQDQTGASIVAQKRNPQQSIYELDYRQATATVPAVGSAHAAWDGLQLAPLFHLGMRHIAEGSDHLMFLLVLLLPAPLLAAGPRWGRPATVRRGLLAVLKIVTAFTIGHSLTLGLAAVNNWAMPARPVEVLIAVSIFVSALHAMRPLFPGREALIAGGFGLIHGLAFAAALDQLGVGRWQRIAGTVSFNLGIEAMQLLVVAAVLPSLILLARTRAYRSLRIGGAALACAASLAWIAERLFQVPTPIDEILNRLKAPAPWIAALIFYAAISMLSMLRLKK